MCEEIKQAVVSITLVSEGERYHVERTGEDLAWALESVLRSISAEQGSYFVAGCISTVIADLAEDEALPDGSDDFVLAARNFCEKLNASL